MATSSDPINVAVLDDYQGVAMSIVDWSKISNRAKVTVFRDHLVNEDDVAQRLSPFDVVCIMRERTPMSASLLNRLPKLKFIASTGPRNASIDLATAEDRCITIAHTGYTSAPTIELTWALILASARHIPSESASVRVGGWQYTLGDDLAGKTLGILGLGNVGSGVAKIGLAFGMNVIAWSQNLTSEAATAVGARLVSKEELLRTADVVSIHMVLSARTTGLIGAAELALMKPSARLINTSRGPHVVEAALLDALKKRQIAGAAIDVFDIEPLPKDHAYRRTDNLLATPHIGYVTRGLYERFYRDSVANISAWLDQQ
ncbi:MAG TPA: D-2-hydroxyacid dehydrogenase family protein [Candidatus Sulfotelmatobacter sp.]|jgi:phosphoglycerate dehydrogenase-like enzyme|nr:D-2-hydroxyacid dehydrogenase family protein [Candidatus Sulfotelmatobacter sp.]